MGLVVRLHRDRVLSARPAIPCRGHHGLARRAPLGDRGRLSASRIWYLTIKAMIWVLVLALGGNACLRAQTPPDPADLIRRSVERDRRNFELLKNYTYTETNEEHEYDKSGRLKKTESETYEVLILGGREYAKLIAKDGKALSESEARKVQEKLDREVRRRERETPQEKAKLEKERQQQRDFAKELPAALDFKLIGEENISGKPAWVISGEPRPDYRARDQLAKIVTKMRGKVWIDKSELQWVKVEAESIGTLSFGLGLLRISPGSILQFEQTRVNDEVWLPASAKIKANGRVALLKAVHADVDIRFQDYKKFQAQSQFTVEAENQ